MEPYLIFLYIGRFSLILLLLLLLFSSFLEFIIWASRSPRPSALDESIPIFDFIAKNLKSRPMTKLALKSTDEIGSWSNYEKFPVLLEWTSKNKWCFCDEIIEQDGRSIIVPYIANDAASCIDEKKQIKVGDSLNDVNVRCHSMQKSTLSLRNYLLKSFSWETAEYTFMRETGDSCPTSMEKHEELSLCAAKNSGIISDIKYKTKTDLSSFDSYKSIGSLNLLTSKSETEIETIQIRGDHRKVYVSTEIAGHPIVRIGVSYGALPCLNGKIPVSYNMHGFKINGEEEEGCGKTGTDEEIFKTVDSLDASIFFELNSRSLFPGETPQSFNLMHVDKFKKAIKNQNVYLFVERKLVMKGNDICDQLLMEQPNTDYAEYVKQLERIRRNNFYTTCGGCALLAVIFSIYWVLTRNVGMRKEKAGIYFFWAAHLGSVLLSIGVITLAVLSLEQVNVIKEKYQFLSSVSSNNCFKNSNAINQVYKTLNKSVNKTYEFSLQFIYFDIVMVCIFLMFEVGLLIVWGIRFHCKFNLEEVEEMLWEENRRKKRHADFD